MKKTTLLFLYLLFSGAMFINAQSKGATDSSVPDNIYSTLCSKAKLNEGMFNIYNLEGKYYFEIPDSLFGRDMLLVTRTSKTAMDMGFGGEELDERVFFWEKSNRKILLRTKIYKKVATKESVMYDAVYSSAFPPIIAAMEIAGYSKDSSVIIDVTDLFGKDILGFGLNATLKKTFGIGNQDDKTSFIISMKSFEKNIEVKTVKSYSITENDKIENDNLKSVSLEIHNSLLLLPEKPMMPRYYDLRVGFFSRSQYDYSFDDAQESVRTGYAKRWRLEPSDVDAYKAGKLVEPIKPIVYYLDSSIPKQWIKYFKLGVEDWNIAFEQAGFKNAIKALTLPTKEEDPDFDIMDARYSSVSYFASYVENSYGPHTADPRSGEIIESHVCIYHNVMKLLHDWYMIQCGAVDPEARKMVYNEDLMGRLIRYLVCHEVGHTLGLAHNFAGSNAFPTDSLRSKTFTDKYGTSASIMDYARFNYIAQPEDNVTNLFPIIGDYDKHAIEWGYRYFPDHKTPDETDLVLDKMLKAKADNPKYLHGEQWLIQKDPRAQTEDLGDNHILASEYGIKNLKYVMDNIGDWTKEEGKSYSNLKKIYKKCISQWTKYMLHVSSNLGGTYQDPKNSDQSGAQYYPVKKDIQKESLDFLEKNALDTPEWLIRNDYYQKFDQFLLEYRNVQESQIRVFNSIFSIGKLLDFIYLESTEPGKYYKPDEYIADVRSAVWRDLYTNATPDINRRILQRAYISKIEEMFKRRTSPDKPDMVSFSDYTLLLKNDLKILKKDLLIKQKRIKNNIIVEHYKDIVTSIDKILDPK
ncbi:MAG: zinc-dependent metalloprotease [Bacteroidales bacterium]|nr:zinc-dependent metalloprotease [Bacteroidales bacterium]